MTYWEMTLSIGQRVRFHPLHDDCAFYEGTITAVLDGGASGFDIVVNITKVIQTTRHHPRWSANGRPRYHLRDNAHVLARELIPLLQTPEEIENFLTS